MERKTFIFNNTDLLTDLNARYGTVMGPAIYDQLAHPAAIQPGVNNTPDCADVLRLSEIAHRLRAHVRDLITHYRAAENTPKNWSMNMGALFDGAGTKGEIFRAYALYKKMNHDFHAVFAASIKSTDVSEPNDIRRWYDGRAQNDAAQTSRRI